MKFELKDKEYIELNKVLKNLSLVSSGGEAKMRISEGEVKVNGHIETQLRKKLRSGDVVQYGNSGISII